MAATIAGRFTVMVDAAEIAVDASDKTAAPVEVRIDDAAAPSPSADAAIDDLKQQIEASKAASAQRLAEKDRQIQEVATRAAHAERRVVETQRSSVGTVLDSIVREKEVLKRDLRAAFDAAEHEKAAELQDKLSLLNARMVEAEKGKQALDEEIQRPQSVQAISRAEQVARGTSPRSAAWIRAHSDLFSTEEKFQTIARAHNYALSEGAREDSDDYFRLIEQRLGLNGESRPNSGRDAARTTEAHAPMAAPVTRDAHAAPGRGNSDNIVRLTAGEQEQAKMDRDSLFPKMSDADAYRMYAVNKRALQSEGKIPS